MIGEGKKIALVIDGSDETRHQENVGLFLDLIKKEDFETYVVSPERPAQADHYLLSTFSNVHNMIEELQNKMDGDDELVIYVTGHGKESGEEGILCMGGECGSETIAQSLDHIAYAQRTVLMSQCYGGNWSKVFLDDPRTLFISAGSKGEVVRGDFSPHLLAHDVPDLNGDKIINWQERFAYVMENNGYGSIPLFVPSPGYVEGGKPPFNDKIINVTTKKSLAKNLKKLNPGQYAVLWFSSGDSDSDRSIEEQAKKAGGQHLWLKTENKESAMAYGITEFPVAVVIDSKGNSNILRDYQAIEEGIALFRLSPEQILMEKIETAVAIKGGSLRDHTVMDAAQYLSKMTISENTESAYKKISKAVKTVKDGECKSNILKYLILVLAKAEFESEKGPLYEELIQAAEKIETLRLRAETMAEIAVVVNDAGLKDMAVNVIIKSIEEAQKMSIVEARVHALKVISSCVKKAGLTGQIELPSF